MRRKVVVVLQLLLVAVVLCQVSVLAQCNDDGCNTWTNECDSGCHHHPTEGEYASQRCCCTTPNLNKCCDFWCYYWMCYTNPHDAGEMACAAHRVTRTQVGGPYFKTCTYQPSTNDTRCE